MKRVIAAALRPAVRTGIRWASAILPVRPVTVISCFPDFEDTLRALLASSFLPRFKKYVLVNGREDPPIWIRAHPDVKLVRRYSPAGVWALITAKYVFYTHGLWIYPAFKTDRLIVNLWHGMPLKKIGLDDPQAGPPPPFDYTVATSEQFRKIIAGCFGVSEDRVWLCGLPRNDILFTSTAAKAQLSGGAKTLLLSLPTFRASARGAIRSDGIEPETPIGIPAPDVERLDGLLAKSSARLVVKPHPMALKQGMAIKEYTNITVLTDADLKRLGMTLYELAAGADALITDYSSIFVDYLLLDRPILYHMPDAEQYLRDRGLYFEINEQYFPGLRSTTSNELIDNIAKLLDARMDDGMQAFRQKARSIYHTNHSQFTRKLEDQVLRTT